MNEYNINNLPSYVTSNDYVVCTYADDKLWFYGSYATIEEAIEVVTEGEDRIVIR